MQVKRGSAADDHNSARVGMYPKSKFQCGRKCALEENTPNRRWECATGKVVRIQPSEDYRRSRWERPFCRGIIAKNEIQRRPKNRHDHIDLPIGVLLRHEIP